MFNIYCDESCHLEKDNSDVMVLGEMKVGARFLPDIYNRIRQIKVNHGLSSWFEVKWTKVSMSKIDFYLDLIDYFFDTAALSFRSVVATGKKKLDHNTYNESDYDNWYYKMYFQLLNPFTTLTVWRIKSNDSS